MWDLSFLTRDWTDDPPALGAWSLNHWITREILIVLQSGLFRPHQNYGIKKPSKNMPTQTFNRLLTRRIIIFQQFLKRRLFLSQLTAFYPKNRLSLSFSSGFSRLKRCFLTSSPLLCLSSTNKCFIAVCGTDRKRS